MQADKKNIGFCEFIKGVERVIRNPVFCYALHSKS